MKYGVLYLLLASGTAYLGIRIGGWAWVLLWISADSLLLAIGYFGLGAKVYGKNPQGGIPLWARVIHLPMMLSSLLVWHLFRLFSRENAYDQVTDELLVGRRLSAREIPDGVDYWVDLTAELEDPKQMRDSPQYICLPILDGTVPDPVTMEGIISRLNHGKTFVHCAQGHSRAALFALALLAQQGVIQDVESGFDLLQKARPGILLNRQQRRFITEYIERMNQIH
jgi:protein-tyrosine phosphatase